MAIEPERLLAIFEARFGPMEKALAKLQGTAGKAFDEIVKAGGRAEDQLAGIGARGAPGMDKLGRSVRHTRMETANLAAQFQDIAVQLQSGTGFMTVALQQGTQMSQILGGQGLRGVVSLLGGAFASLVSPVSLITIGLVAAAGAAYQYFSGVNGDVPSATDLLKEHEDVIKRLRDAYGLAEEGAKEYSETAKQIALQDAISQWGSYQKAIEQAGEALRHQANVGSILPWGDSALTQADFEGDIDAMQRFGAALAKLDKEQPDFSEFARMMGEIANSDAPPRVREVAASLRAAADEPVKLQKAVERADKAIRDARNSTDEAKKTMVDLIGVAVGLGAQGGDAIRSMADKIRDDLIPMAEKALQTFGRMVDSYLNLQSMVERAPLGTLSPLVSGGGQFLNPDQFNTFRAQQDQLRGAGSSSAAQMLRSQEGFRQNAYWDVNAWRTGYGSDTATRANGMIEKVTQQTVVTLADAERDLARRILEFQGGIQSAIGSDVWQSLNESQQAALTSIAYNYGSLPQKIVEAIKKGGGPEVVAKAIAELTSNPTRRKEEAQAYLSGSGVTMAEAGLTTSGRRSRTPEDVFRGSVDQVQERINLINAELEAQRGLTSGVNDYGYALEKARIKQQLMNDAKAAGVAITPELSASIDQLAENYARASANVDQLAASQKQAGQAAREFGEFGKATLGGFIRDLMAGKDASEALANALSSVADRLLDLALDSLFSGFGGGGGGILGALFGGGSSTGNLLWSKGGYTGAGGKNEPAGVVHKGEVVWSQDDVRRAGGPAVVDAMRRGARGYANGGYVGRVNATPPLSRADVSNSDRPIANGRPSSRADTMNVRVDIDGARGDAEIEAAARRGTQQAIDHYDRTRAPATAVRSMQQYQQRAT